MPLGKILVRTLQYTVLSSKRIGSLHFSNIQKHPISIHLFVLGIVHDEVILFNNHALQERRT